MATVYSACCHAPEDTGDLSNDNLGHCPKCHENAVFETESITADQFIAEQNVPDGFCEAVAEWLEDNKLARFEETEFAQIKSHVESGWYDEQCTEFLHIVGTWPILSTEKAVEKLLAAADEEIAARSSCFELKEGQHELSVAPNIFEGTLRFQLYIPVESSTADFRWSIARYKNGLSPRCVRIGQSDELTWSEVRR